MLILPISILFLTSFQFYLPPKPLAPPTFHISLIRTKLQSISDNSLSSFDSSMLILRHLHCSTMKQRTLQNLEIMRIKATKNIQKDSQNGLIHSIPQNRMVLTQASCTPALMLPKIGLSHGQTPSFSHSSEGISQLERYVNQLLLKHQAEESVSKKRKKFDDDLNERKQKLAQQEQKNKQEKESRYMKRLKVKLNIMQIDMEVEQKKLELDYRFDGKMMDCYNQLFERFRPTPLPQEKAINNTEPTVNVAPSNTEEPIKEIIKEKVDWKRKFRIAGYAVYFSVLFPKYVQKFNQLRRIKFEATISKTRVLRKEIEAGFKLFETMKINTFWKQLERQNRKEKGNFAYFDFQETDDIGNQIEFSFRLSNISQFLLLILGHLRNNIMEGNFDILINLLSYILVNKSFLVDRLLFLHQIYRIELNHANKTLKLSKQQQLALLINFFIIKFTINGYMVKYGESSERKSDELFTNNGLKAKKTNDNMMIQKQLLISSVYLLNLTNQITFHSEADVLLRKNGNIEKLMSNTCPLLMKNLQFSKDIIIGQEQPSQSEIKKRSSIQNMINIEQVQQKGILIDNMNNFIDIVSEIQSNDTKKDEIVALIKQIGELLHQKCKKYRTDHYKAIHREMLEKKKILTEPFSAKQFVFNRKEEDLLEINTYLKLIKLARQAQHQSEEENQKEVTQNRLPDHSENASIDASQLSAEVKGEAAKSSVEAQIQSSLKDTIKQSSVEDSAKDSKSSQSFFQHTKLPKRVSYQDASQAIKSHKKQQTPQNSQKRQTHQRKRGSRGQSNLQLNKIIQNEQDSNSSL